MEGKIHLLIAVLAVSITACKTTQQTIPEAYSENPYTNNDTTDRFSSEEAEKLEELFWARRDSLKLNFVQADVDFMTGMIGHHSQALIMSSLAKPNNANRSVQILAARIINAQKDEIAIMQRWLSDRNQTVPQVKIKGLNLMINPGNEPLLEFTEQAVIDGLERNVLHERHDMGTKSKEKPEDMQEKMHNEVAESIDTTLHMADNGMDTHKMINHDHAEMPGMLSQFQLEELAEAKGGTFDFLYLRYMIQHHTGAITMVNNLVEVDGAVQDVAIGKLADDINVDQKTEIERMRLMLMQIMEAEGVE